MYMAKGTNTYLYIFHPSDHPDNWFPDNVIKQTNESAAGTSAWWWYSVRIGALPCDKRFIPKQWLVNSAMSPVDRIYGSENPSVEVGASSYRHSQWSTCSCAFCSLHSRLYVVKGTGFQTRKITSGNIVNVPLNFICQSFFVFFVPKGHWEKKRVSDSDHQKGAGHQGLSRINLSFRWLAQDISWYFSTQHERVGIV